MALGIAPKIAVIAFAGGSLMAAIQGNPVMAALAAIIAVALYAGIALYARRRMARKGQILPARDVELVDSAPESAE